MEQLVTGGPQKAKTWSYVIAGAGPGGAGFVHPLLAEKVAECDYLLGSARLLKLFADGSQVKIETGADFRELDELQAGSAPGKVCLLVSGDPGLFSAGSRLAELLPRDKTEIIPNLSAAQILFAAAGVAWHEVEFISFHGRPVNMPLLAAKLLAGAKVCLFLDAESSAHAICAELSRRGVTGRAVVGANLGLANQEVLSVSIDSVPPRSGRGLSLIYLQAAACEGYCAREDRGTLLAVGVGPGSSDEMTLRAVRTIRSADIVFAPRSSIKSESLALSIAAPFVSSSTRVVELVFPMSRDKSVLESHWRKAAATIAAEVGDNATGVFLTLGDPTIYSTFAYVLRELRNSHPQVDVEIVPGVSSALAAAAACGQVLVEGDERLAVMPAAEGLSSLGPLLEKFDSVVLLKVGRHLGAVRAALEANGLLESSYLVSRLGCGNEERIVSMSDVNMEQEGNLGYFSTIVIKRSETVE